MFSNLHSLEFSQNRLGNNNLFSNQSVVLVVTVVCITQLSIRTEIKFQELMTELATMTNIVAQVEALLISLVAFIVNHLHFNVGCWHFDP